MNVKFVLVPLAPQFHVGQCRVPDGCCTAVNLHPSWETLNWENSPKEISIISSNQTFLCPRWRYYLFLKVACCKHNPEKCPGRGRPVFLALWAGTSTDAHSLWCITSLSPWEAGLAAIGCSALGDLAQEVELILSMEGPQGCYGLGVVWRMWEPL